MEGFEKGKRSYINEERKKKEGNGLGERGKESGHIEGKEN